MWPDAHIIGSNGSPYLEDPGSVGCRGLVGRISSLQRGSPCLRSRKGPVVPEPWSFHHLLLFYLARKDSPFSKQFYEF